MNIKRARVVLIHPALRSYRLAVYRELHRLFDMRFVFTDSRGWMKKFPETASWHYGEFVAKPMFGYSSGVSWSYLNYLWKHRSSYDIVIGSSMSSFSTHVFFILSKLLRKRFIVWCEDWVWPRRLGFRLILPYVRFIARNSDAFIAAGSKARSFLIHLGASPEKVFIALNGAEDVAASIDMRSERVQSLRQKVNPHGLITFAYLGRVVEYKNLDALIRAFAKLESGGSQALLLIAGHGSFEGYCRSLLKSLKVKNVYWPTKEDAGARTSEPINRERLMEFLAMSDVFILPGKFDWKSNVPSEAWGMTVNEAMSLSKPVISTTSVASAFDLIQNGSNGFQVEENNPDALASAMQYFLDHPHEIQKFGGTSLQILHSRCSLDKQVSGYDDAIQYVQKTTNQ